MDRRGFFKGLLGLIAAAVAGSVSKTLGKESGKPEPIKYKELTDKEISKLCSTTTNSLPDSFTYCYPQNIYTHNDRIFFYKNGTGTLDFWDDPKEDRYAWTDGEPVE